MHLIFMMLGMLVLAVGGSSEAQAQPNVPEAELLERLCAAAGRGDTRALLEPVGDRVEVNLFGVSNFYSRDQAQYVLEETFKQHPPERCQLQPSSQAEAALFSAALLWWQGGSEPLHLYFSLRRRGGTWHLHTIRLDRPSPPRDR